MATKKLKSPKEVAQLLSVSEKTVWKMAREGRVPHHRFGRLIRFSDEDIEQLYAQSRVEPAASGPVPVSRTR
jgi:excisionase family DNA binding protein